MLLDEKEARKRIAALPRRNEPAIKWAGFELPGETAEGNLLVVGGIGTGKSLMQRELMRSVVPTISPNSGRKAVIYDLKCDLLSSLYAMPLASEVLIFNPCDRRSVAWDLAADFQTESEARAFAEAFIRSNEPDQAPFFLDSARAVLAGVVNSLNRARPGNWDLRRLIHITANPTRLKSVLSPSEYERYSSPASVLQNIQSTIISHLGKFEQVAALWEHTRQKISLKNWAKHGESILVLGNNLELMQPLQLINAAASKIIATTILSEPESPGHSRLWFFCDDLDGAGRIDALPTLENGRSRGVRCALGFQNIEQLGALYGSLGKAKEIAALCNTISWLKLATAETADWASRATGGAVRPSEFLNLPAYGSAGVSGIHLIRGVGGAFKSSAKYAFPRAKTPDFESRPDSDGMLSPWTAADDE